MSITITQNGISWNTDGSALTDEQRQRTQSIRERQTQTTEQKHQDYYSELQNSLDTLKEQGFDANQYVSGLNQAELVNLQNFGANLATKQERQAVRLAAENRLKELRANDPISLGGAGMLGGLSRGDLGTTWDAVYSDGSRPVGRGDSTSRGTHELDRSLGVVDTALLTPAVEPEQTVFGTQETPSEQGSPSEIINPVDLANNYTEAKIAGEFEPLWTTNPDGSYTQIGGWSVEADKTAQEIGQTLNQQGIPLSFVGEDGKTYYYNTGSRDLNNSLHGAGVWGDAWSESEPGGWITKEGDTREFQHVRNAILATGLGIAGGAFLNTPGTGIMGGSTTPAQAAANVTGNLTGSAAVNQATQFALGNVGYAGAAAGADSLFSPSDALMFSGGPYGQSPTSPSGVIANPPPDDELVQSDSLEETIGNVRFVLETGLPLPPSYGIKLEDLMEAPGKVADYIEGVIDGSNNPLEDLGTLIAGVPDKVKGTILDQVAKGVAVVDAIKDAIDTYGTSGSDTSSEGGSPVTGSEQEPQEPITDILSDDTTENEALFADSTLDEEFEDGRRLVAGYENIDMSALDIPEEISDQEVSTTTSFSETTSEDPITGSSSSGGGGGSGSGVSSEAEDFYATPDYLFQLLLTPDLSLTDFVASLKQRMNSK